MQDASVIFVSEGKLFPVVLSRESSCDEVRSQWSQLTGRPAEHYSFFLGACNGPELPRDALLTEVMDRDALTISIFADRLRSITADVIGAPEEALQLAYNSQTQIEDLIAQVRRQLNTSDDRQVRLRTRNGILNSAVPLLEQLSSEDRLEIDLELRIDLVPMTAFSSYPIVGNQHFPILPNSHFDEEIRQLAQNRHDCFAPPMFVEEAVRQVSCFASEANNVCLVVQSEEESKDASDEHFEASVAEEVQAGRQTEDEGDHAFNEEDPSVSPDEPSHGSQEETDDQEAAGLLDEEEEESSQSDGADHPNENEDNVERTAAQGHASPDLQEDEGDQDTCTSESLDYEKSSSNGETSHLEESEDAVEESIALDNAEQRIFSLDRKRQFPLEVSVGDVLANDVRTEWKTAVLLESKVRIVVDNRINAKQLTVSLWPSTKLSHLLRGKKQHVMINGEVINPKLSLWEAGISDDTVVIVTELVTLQVVDSNGRRHSLTTDLHQSGADLHQLVSKFEKSPTAPFVTWSDGRCLSSEARTLAHLGVQQLSKVHLVLRGRQVEVMEGEELLATFDDVKEGTEFHEFIAMMNDALGTTLRPDTSFKCGCGRVFSNQSRQRREFPISCCPDVVLRLEMRCPEDKSYRGRWIESHYRLPPGGASDVLDMVSRLAACDRGKEWKETEEALVRSLLTIEEATEVRIEADERLDLLLQVSRDLKVPWSVRPTETVSAALKDFEVLPGTIADVAVRGTRPVKAHQKAHLTFAGLGAVSGQTLTVVRREADGE